MTQQQLDKIVKTLKDGMGPAPKFSVEVARKTWYLYTEDFVLPANVSARSDMIGGMRAEWLRGPRADDRRVLVYLHGGGYVCGGIESHRPITAGLAEDFVGSVMSIDYRLAPEHPYPAQLDDAVQAYKHLLDLGYAPAQIAIGGESAGGGLTVGTMLKILDLGLPKPGAGWIISPWSDLTHAGESITKNAPSDPIVFKSAIDLTRDLYLAGVSYSDRYASPALADLKGLPPLLIQVAAAEILLDDAFRLARSAAYAGVDVTLEAWPGMVHAWHLFARDLTEGRSANLRAAAWLNERL